MVDPIQTSHYNRIAQEYANHYDDDISKAYRERFIYSELFLGLDLSSKNVLDAMCGYGSTSEYLRKLGAKVTALDISEVWIDIYKKRIANAEAVCSSITETPFPDASFDAVVIVGGLHHVHPCFNKAIEEIYRILKPGGRLCCFEPPARTVLDALRKIWYRFDPMFADNEASIDIKRFEREHGEKFILRNKVYGGGPAYWFIYNSLIFRMPKWLKRLLAPCMLFLERMTRWLVTPILSSFVILQVEKRMVGQ